LENPIWKIAVGRLRRLLRGAGFVITSAPAVSVFDMLCFRA
jgi:hypothetical protein